MRRKGTQATPNNPNQHKPNKNQTQRPEAESPSSESVRQVRKVGCNLTMGLNSLRRSVRRAQVDAGYRVTGRVRHHSQHLQIVHLASTVTSPQTKPSAAAMHFAGSLPQVVRSLGHRSLQNAVPCRIHRQSQGSVPFTNVQRLRQLDLEPSECNSNSVMRVLPERCFLELAHCQEAFLKCASLTAVRVPPTLLCVAGGGPLPDARSSIDSKELANE